MKRFLFILLACCVSLQLYAQNFTVTGKVLDESGRPLIGATILIAGTTTSTTTAVNGSFTLTLPNGQARLNVTYVGYLAKEVAVNGAKTLTINMQPAARDLNEVVVVAYGTQKRTSLTGSVSTISASEIRKNTVSDLTNTITGALPAIRTTGLTRMQLPVRRCL
jgi:hypothetical protein